MTCIIYSGGEEINRIEADETFANQYCQEHGYTWEKQPDPEPVEPEPTAEDDTAAMLVDHEYRLTLLELGIDGEEV